LTPAQFSELAEVPPEIEWLGNITNKKTQRACKIDVQGFVDFTGLREPAALGTVARPHVTPGASIWSRASCRMPASSASSRRFPRSLIISASAMP
jgi:hypothetical protein